VVSRRPGWVFAAHRYYEVGIEHLAFTVASRSEVDDAYQRCLDMGARVHYPPAEESDMPGYYAFFVFDPDGIRIEVNHWSEQERRQWDDGLYRGTSA
jgi:catechol 2,3-dioxygenase-like lactoylglutathione lyase family enzyme